MQCVLCYVRGFDYISKRRKTSSTQRLSWRIIARFPNKGKYHDPRGLQRIRREKKNENNSIWHFLFFSFIFNSKDDFFIDITVSVYFLATMSADALCQLSLLTFYISSTYAGAAWVDSQNVRMTIEYIIYKYNIHDTRTHNMCMKKYIYFLLLFVAGLPACCYIFTTHATNGTHVRLMSYKSICVEFKIRMTY